MQLRKKVSTPLPFLFLLFWRMTNRHSKIGADPEDPIVNTSEFINQSAASAPLLPTFSPALDQIVDSFL
jgi:hypothetical protein